MHQIKTFFGCAVMVLHLFVMPPDEQLTVMFTENRQKHLINFREFSLKTIGLLSKKFDTIGK